MAQSTKQQKKTKAPKGKPKFKNSLTPVAIVLGILVVLMAVLFLLCALLFSPQRRQHTPDPAPEGSTWTAAEPEDPTDPDVQAPTVSEGPSLPFSTLTAECFGEENGYKTYQSKDLTAKLGIDVSSHQGWIDWQAVSDSGLVDYAILRAGYRGYSQGETNQDEFFQYNLEYATALGMDVGVYYFSQALTEEEAIAEAEEVLSMVEGYTLAYPIYFDWEIVTDSNARTATISSSELTACARAFCETIEEAGYEAGIYFNLSTATQLYRLSELMDYDFWLAEYRDTPSYPFEINMWQYTDAGTLPGINEYVDLNLSFR